MYFILSEYNMNIFLAKHMDDRRNGLIVFATFMFLYIYLSYVSSRLKRTKNWQGVKCNPLEMVVGSIIDAGDSNSNFEKCMQYSVSEDQEKRIQQHYSKVNNEMQRQINNLTSGITYDENATNSLLGKTADQINTLKTENIADNETTLNNLKINVQQLTDKVNTAFNTFSDPSNNLLKKLEL